MLEETLFPLLQHFNGVLQLRYAVQVAVNAEGAGVDPFEYEGRLVKVSAADFLAILL